MGTTITRKRFLVSLFGSTAAVLLDGCGGGGSSYSSPMPPPAASCGATGTAIANNHAAPYAHALNFPKTDVNLMTDQTYGIMGAALHSHNVTLRAATELAQLKAGMQVVVTSTTADGGPGIGLHSHDVAVSCS